jgi:hypothetical protein
MDIFLKVQTFKSALSEYAPNSSEAQVSTSYFA